MLLAMVCSSMLAYGEKTLDLFTADALVVNQTTEVRQQAAANGLATVLVRLSGSQDVLSHPEIRNALANASRYLYEFSYQSTDQTLTIAGAARPATRLLMRFSATPLEQLLQAAQLPVWSSSRPDMLVWTAIDGDKKAYVAADSSMGLALKVAAQGRGLPITMPVLDLQDRSALSLTRLWAMDEGSVRVASRRYDTDAVLAGRFSEDRSQWTGNFMLLYQGKTRYLTASGNSQPVVANEIINQVTDFFASLFSVTTGSQIGAEPVLVQVNNITDFAAYIAVLNYLEKLPLVQTVILSSANRENLRVKVQLNTDIPRFLNAMELDRKLKRLNENSTSSLPELSVSLHPSGVAPTDQSSIGNSAVINVPAVVTTEKKFEFVWQ